MLSPESSDVLPSQMPPVDIAYDVFISYSTDPDYYLARSLFRFLSSFHRLPALAHRGLPPLKVCLDNNSFLSRRTRQLLTVSEIVRENLQRSEQLIVLCSRGAASSQHVADEVAWFLEHRGPQAIHVAVTEGADPNEGANVVFPKPIIEAGLHRSIWYDLRGLRPWRARRWKKVRDARRERIRLLADVLTLAGKTEALSADDLYPDWLEHEQRQTRRRRVQWGIAGVVLSLCALIAIGAIARSKVQGTLAALRERAAAAVRIASLEPERASHAAASVWRELGPFAEGKWYLPGMNTEVMQSRIEAHRALFTILSLQPGRTHTLTLPLENPLVRSSRNADWLVSAGTRSGLHIVEVWHWRGEEIHRSLEFTWPEPVQCLSLSSNGKALLVAGRRFIGLRSLLSGQEDRLTPQIDLAQGSYSNLSCSSAVIAPDGTAAVIGTSDGDLFRMALPNGPLKKLDIGNLGGIINDLVFDASGGTLYIAIWRHSPALLKLNLEIAPLSAIPLVGDDAPRALALGVDGSMLYSGHERGLVSAKFATTNKTLWRVRASQASIVAMSILEGGLIIGDESGELHRLDLGNGTHRLPPLRMARSTITSMAPFPTNGAVAVAGAGDPIRVWHADAAHPLEQILGRNTGGALGATIDESGKTIAIYSTETLTSWIQAQGQWRQTSRTSMALPEGWSITSVSRDRRFKSLSAAYAKKDPDGLVRLATTNGITSTLGGFDAKIQSAVFSPSGRTLAIASFDRPLQVFLWNTATPTQKPRVLEATNGIGATAIAFSQDESMLAASDLRGCVYLWNLNKSESSLSECSEAERSDHLAFHPTRPLLAVGSLSGRINLLEVSDTRLIKKQKLDAHREHITALAFDPSGQWLASASNDGELRFWEASTWQPIGVMRDPDDSFVRQILPGPDPGTVVTLSQGGKRLSIWTLDPSRAALRAEQLSRQQPN